MNTIKIYLSSSGSLAELKKDFPLYQGAFNDKLLNVYVPTSLLPGTVDTQYVDEAGFVHTEPGVFTAVKIGMVSIGRDGRVNKTNAYYMRYLKKLVYQGIEYALYERALPQAFTLFEGQNSQAPKLIINVVNMENNNEYNGEEVILGEPKILQVITSQQCSLDVLPSTSFDRDELIEATEWDDLSGKVNDVYEKYDYIVNNIDAAIADYTYDKDVIDQKDADTLQQAKDYADENFYNETESDARFVHLTGNETIGGIKTFTDSPIVPNASANTHAVNRSDMYGYTYSKEQIRDLTQAVVFETQAQFENWLAGTYTRPDGYAPADLIVGKTVIIEETSPNWLCIHTPATTLADFEEKAEDVKFLSEINATPYKNITANNGQAFVNELKDQVDLKAQIIELEDLTIETIDWVNDGGNIYFDYANENFTDPTKQFFEFVSNNKDQNEAIANDGFSILALETILDGADYKVRLFANKVPSIDIVLKVNLINYTNEVFEAGEITANKIIYSNTISGLTAKEVQGAIDELKGITDDLESDKVDKSAIKQTTGTSETDLMSQKAITSELASKADISFVDGLAKELLTEPINLTFISAGDNPDADGMDKGALNAGYDYKVVLTADMALPILEARKIEITFKDFGGFPMSGFAFTMTGYGFGYNGNKAYFGKYPFSTGDTLDIQFGACEAMCLINGTTLTFYIKKGPSHSATIFSPYFVAAFYPHKITSVRLY